MATVLQQDVLRLDVAVDDTLAVSIMHGVGDLGRDPNGVIHRKLFFPTEPVTEALPLHVRHHIAE